MNRLQDEYENTGVIDLKHYLNMALGNEKEANALLRAIRHNKTIIISGKNGPTGKTTLAHVLKRFNVPVIEDSPDWTYHVNFDTEIPKEDRIDRLIDKIDMQHGNLLRLLRIVDK